MVPLRFPSAFVRQGEVIVAPVLKGGTCCLGKDVPNVLDIFFITGFFCSNEDILLLRKLEKYLRLVHSFSTNHILLVINCFCCFPCVKRHLSIDKTCACMASLRTYDVRCLVQ